MPGGRSNQQLRTRAALLQAAGKLLSAGQQPSVAAAAEEALVSVATAYRYFATADELWTEAAQELTFDEEWFTGIERLIEEAGEDIAARAVVAARATVEEALEKPYFFRRAALAGQQQWFAQQADPEASDAPVRAGRRNRIIQAVLAPLRQQGNEDAVRRLEAALTVLLGAEVMISLVDVARLEPDDVIATVTDMTCWVMASALPELT
ncbi:MAG: regulatory protein TetR [Marmoricola sp.]|nr:regulatory protein TetR [Marmoricola sp.]